VTLRHYIALHLALTACLSSFVLGLGQNDLLLPLITLIGAGISFWFVDYKEKFHFGPYVSNALILMIVIASIGYLMQSVGDLLAIAIVRVLVLVQLVLLFREKTARTRWHIMMLSFLELIVASVFQQTILFGFLIVVYLFLGLTVVTLMHLNQDRTYFGGHVFLRSLFRRNFKETFSRDSLLRILKIAVATSITGPLSLVLQYRGHAVDPSERERWKISGKRWETSTEENLAKEMPAGKMPEEKPGGKMPKTDAFHKIPKPAFLTNADEKFASRWPLLREKATFSGTVSDQAGLVGVGWEFYRRLVFATFLSLLFGLFVFYFLPRQNFKFADVEIRQSGWNGQTPQQQGQAISTVGFNKEVRLGSLGNVLKNSNVVMRLRFLVSSDLRNSDKTKSDNTKLEEYAAIRNQSVFLRGAALPDYQMGRWRGGDTNKKHYHFEYGSVYLLDSQNYYDRGKEIGLFTGTLFDDHSRFLVNSFMNPFFIPGAALAGFSDLQLALFQPGTQLVRVESEYEMIPQDQAFVIWPFFMTGRQNRNTIVFQDRVLLQPDQYHSETFRFNFWTNAFQNGRQVDLIPCQEPLNTEQYLKFQEKDVPTVAKTALEWDRGREDKNFMERAGNLERHFLEDERFYYMLGGIARDQSLDPLEDFIKKNPGGHCEYFAGALAVMLRKIGIPSRLIVGYRIDTGMLMSQENDRYVVRQSDAHSWVEAYIPPDQIPEELRIGPHSAWWSRGGWLRLDPTAPVREIKRQAGTLSLWQENLSRFWNDYVINFNNERQKNAIYQPIGRFLVSVKERFFEPNDWKTIAGDVLEKYQTIFNNIRNGVWRKSDLAFLIAPVVLLSAIGVTIHRKIVPLLKFLWRQRRRRQKDADFVPVEFYRRLETILAKIGLKRFPSETQREFSRRITDQMISKILSLQKEEKASDLPTLPTPEFLKTLVPAVAEAFYRVRYGEASLSSGETETINEILSQIEKIVLQSRFAGAS